MPSLKDLRNRIDSVKSTRKITSAMKMVAAAKLRRAQEQATHARPFAEGMGRMVANLATAMAGDARAPRLMTGSGKDERHLIVVVTADRGLCGGFNTTVVRETRNRVRALRCYHDFCARLRNTVGIDPSPEFHALVDKASEILFGSPSDEDDEP